MEGEAVQQPRWAYARPEEAQHEQDSPPRTPPGLDDVANTLFVEHGAQVALRPAELLQAERTEESDHDVLLREQLAAIDAELERRALAGDSDASVGEEPMPAAVVAAPRHRPELAEEMLRWEREQRRDARERRAREREERLMHAAQQNGLK